MIFDLSRRLQRRRQELRLVVPDSSPLGRVLVLTDVNSVAPVHSSLEAARWRRSLQSPAYEGRRSMAHESPKRIRNVALAGHRGSGKTSVNEALLFTAGAINRLGSVADGTTVSDSASDEKAREMSISASLSSFRWDDRKINLIDTPGEPSFVADALCALRVCEGAVFVINGVMGAEVTTSRLWERASDLGLARILFVNMLDRERSDFFRALDSLKQAFGQHVVATEIPIGAEHELEGVVDLIDMKAYRYDGDGRDNRTEIPIPDDLAERAQEMREKLMDEVAEVSDELMERYLEGEEISHEETVTRAEDRRDGGPSVPRHPWRRHAQPRHQPAARRVRRGPPSPAKARSTSTAWRWSRTRSRTRSRSCSRRSPTPTPAG